MNLSPGSQPPESRAPEFPAPDFRSPQLRTYEQHLPLLHPGDQVAVITPGGPVDATRLVHGCQTLKNWGLDPILGQHVGTATAMSAGTDAERTADLLWALSAPHIRAVFCGRGGYGTLRVLEHLDWSALAEIPPKPVIGFSDITVLHAALRIRLGWATILGVHVAGGLASSTPDDPSPESLRSLLFDGTLAPLLAGEPRVIRGGRVDSVTLVGGNLALLAAMAGSPEGAPPGHRFVAVLEDVNEAPYRVDRMLTQLRRAGWFANAVGVVCGSWLGCQGIDREVGPSAEMAPAAPRSELEEVLIDRLADVDGPLVFDAPFGHSGKHLAIPLGIPVDLDTSVRALSFSDAPPP